jgi:hypothetical protein
MDKITLPPGVKNHGDPNLLCSPPKWTDFLTFFVTNYFLHAATVTFAPGQPSLEKIIGTANALFIPASGALRAIRIIIIRSTIHRRDPLRTAARAGALCMVVSQRSIEHGWREEELVDPNIWFRCSTDAYFISTNTTFLGTCQLPNNQYHLIEVPPEVPLMPYNSEASDLSRSSLNESDTPSIHSSEPELRVIEVPSTTNVLKVFVSIIQLMWGSFTLFGARGNQIQLYGYGAFGLTVAPYALMSLLNLITNLLRPDYPSMYLIHTKDMDYATRDGGVFSGMVASVDTDRFAAEFEEPIDLGNELFREKWMLPLYFLSYFIIAIVVPLGIVGGVTGFREGSDITVRRAWILAWLIVGSVSSVLILWGDYVLLRAPAPGKRRRHRHRQSRLTSELIIIVFTSIPLWIPAIGGMVVVGQELKDFGICSDIG